jgi:hypothetical protein
MSSDIVQKFPTLGECNRYTNGICSTRSCLIRGGWKQGDAVDYDLATCETRDIRRTIEALEGERDNLKWSMEKYEDRAEAAEERAERLRVALKSITLSYEERCGIDHATLARSALENDQ